MILVLLGMAIDSLVIDGTREKEKELVVINELPVFLTGKSFKYITKLAYARTSPKHKGGWIHKEDLEPGFDQARYLYRIRNEINEKMGGDCEVVENNKRGYYRLNVDPANIAFNEENLRTHEHFEIRMLFADA